MRHAGTGGSFPHMPLWAVTIVICATIWVVGSILVVLGATWLVRHNPD